MSQYFVEGGFPMWIISIGGVVSAVGAVALGGERRSQVLAAGAFFCLMAGVLGMATGMEAVSEFRAGEEISGRIVATGLGELANNGTFACAFALPLWIGSLLTARRAPAPEPRGA